jgi:hypothetical protein
MLDERMCYVSYRLTVKLLIWGVFDSSYGIHILFHFCMYSLCT